MSTALVPAPVLVVFSHQRWDFVFRRAQQLMSRLAGRWRVLFVEEPVRSDGAARLQRHDPCEHLSVLVPHTPLAARGFHDDQLATLQTLLERFLVAEGLRVDVTWLDTPMALPLVRTLHPACIVYDCVDDLGALQDAPRQLRQRESALLRRATLVFAGGPTLYEARRAQHPHVVCLPSAVDAGHFNPATLRTGSEDAQVAALLQGGLPGPRLGFFGVIDERVDLALVAALTDAHPEWSVVMVGPVVRLDAARLPQRHNLHWLGRQPYARLPYLLDGWDVALLPFVRDASTRCLSPTKTLEYLAGDKPVVGTALRDVVALYGDVVDLADGAVGFVHACEAVLAERPAARCRRLLDTIQVVARFSWDGAASAVHALLLQALQRARGAHQPAPPPLRVAAGGG